MNLEDLSADGVGQDNGNYFGLPFSPEESKVALLSVPWDVTASYGAGSSFAPDAIIGASIQLDLYDQAFPDAWKEGIGTIGIDYTIQEKSTFLREDAVKIMKHLEKGGRTSDDYVKRKADRINEASEELNRYVYEESMRWLSKGKTVGLVGGDHSTPFGLIRAVAEKESGISVLHIDAHADLREKYEGFSHSHASIMYNVVNEISGVDKLVQVGIRDYCESEVDYARLSNGKIEQVTDFDLASALFMGYSWDSRCEDIISRLGKNVYVSFDIDGLSPDNSPNTGTPVPGGLSYNQAIYLLNKLSSSGRRIAGFDLCEVCPVVGNEWDANVGARILLKLCNLSIKTRNT